MIFGLLVTQHKIISLCSFPHETIDSDTQPIKFLKPEPQLYLPSFSSTALWF